MEQQVVVRLHTDFEGARRVAEDGTEFWMARDLQVLLGYEKWDNFLNVVKKAKDACQNSGQAIDHHFADSGKMVEVGSGSVREVDDVALTRYACYLSAQNGDPGKPEIAFAQTYFALQTRKQELVIQRMAELERLGAREKLTTSEKELSGIIYERLGDGGSFALIRSKGDRALFGGKTTQDMKKALNVPDGRPLADFLPTITIKAKDFANEVTNFNIKKDDLKTEHAITNEHVKNNKDVRDLLKGRGIVPEDLPAAEDCKKVERRLNSETKNLPKKTEKLKGKGDPELPT